MDQAICEPVYKTNANARLMREDERKLVRDVPQKAFEARGVPCFERRCTLLRAFCGGVVSHTPVTYVPAGRHGQHAHSAVTNQRSQSAVTIGGQTISKTGRGLIHLVGIGWSMRTSRRNAPRPKKTGDVAENHNEKNT